MLNTRGITNNGDLFHHELEVIVYGKSNRFTSAVMVGPRPAIEGPPSTAASYALENLLLATCRLLNRYVLKIGDAHKRQIRSGGVFDNGFISQVIIVEKERGN